jgi:hypothetical protein
MNEVDEEWSMCKKIVPVAPLWLYTELSGMVKASHNVAGFQALVSISTLSI